jgi:hypothetical protein
MTAALSSRHFPQKTLVDEIILEKSPHPARLYGPAKAVP